MSFPGIGHRVWGGPRKRVPLYQQLLVYITGLPKLGFGEDAVYKHDIRIYRLENLKVIQTPSYSRKCTRCLNTRDDFSQHPHLSISTFVKRLRIQK
jgi:hypothetical protein